MVLDAPLERRQVDERLERRARLPTGAHGAVELGRGVGPPADHGEHVARARVHGHERRLGGAAAPRLEARVDGGEPLTDRRLRQALEAEVERRVDVDRARVRSGQVRQRVGDRVDEVGRLGVEAAPRGDHRLGRRPLGRLARDGPHVRHDRQHQVAAQPRPVGRAERRVDRRGLDQAGERGRFGQAQVRRVLPEIQPRALGGPVHGERAVLAQVHLVQVQLEDLVLAQPALEDERHELLLELAPERLLRREDHVLDQLLGDRAPADQVRPVAAQVGEERAGGADRVDAGVLVEPAVLDGEHRLDEVGRDGAERHVAALLAAIGHGGREERRVEGQRGQRPAVRVRQARDPARRAAPRRGEHDPHEAAAGVAPAGHQLHDLRPGGELAGHLGARARRVAEVVQLIDEVRFRERLPGVQHEGTGEEARRRLDALTAQALVEAAREIGVGVAGQRRRDDRDGREPPGHPDAPRAPAASPAGPCRPGRRPAWRRPAAGWGGAGRARGSHDRPIGLSDDRTLVVMLQSAPFARRGVRSIDRASGVTHVT